MFWQIILFQVKVQLAFTSPFWSLPNKAPVIPFESRWRQKNIQYVYIQLLALTALHKGVFLERRQHDLYLCIYGKMIDDQSNI